MVLVLRKPHEVAPSLQRDVPRRGDVVVGDDGLQTLHVVELARPEIDEPGDRRGFPPDHLDRGLIELLQERDLVGDPRARQGFGGDRPTRDPVRIDVAVHADAVRGPEPVRNLSGLCFHPLTMGGRGP